MTKRVFTLLMAACLLWCGLPIRAQAYEQDICSPWAERYVYSSRMVYKFVPWEAEARDLTAAATPERFVEYMNRISEKIRKDFYDLSFLTAPAVPLTFDVPAGTHITREEAAKYFVQIAEYYGMQTAFPDQTEFWDAALIAPDCREAVDTVRRLGVFVGDENGCFLPKRPITGEQVIAAGIRLDAAVATYYSTYKVKLDNGTFFNESFLWFWTEDAEGRLLHAFPKWYPSYGYRSDWGVRDLRCITVDGQPLLDCWGSRTPDEEFAHYFLDPETLETLYILPGDLGALDRVSKDGKCLVFRQHYSSDTPGDFGYDLYCVYDLDGNAILPMGTSYYTLKNSGY